MKCPQILREKTLSQKYTVIALRIGGYLPADSDGNGAAWFWKKRLRVAMAIDPNDSVSTRESLSKLLLLIERIIAALKCETVVVKKFV